MKHLLQGIEQNNIKIKHLRSETLKLDEEVCMA